MKRRDIKSAPWRMKYLSSDGIKGCFVCQGLEQEPSPDNLFLINTGTVGVMLNRYPYNNGHLMIVPAMHVSTMQEIPDEVLSEMMYWVKVSEKILGSFYSPQGFNVGINIGAASGAGLDSHIHIHILPRWSGDTNFMTTVADVRVVPEELSSTWKKLQPEFQRELEAIKS